MKRRLVRLMTCGGAVASLTTAFFVLPSVSASADDGAVAVEPSACSTAMEAQMTGVTESSQLSTPVITAGTLKREEGSVPVSGARVRLMAWPSAEALAVAPEGETVVMKAIGWAQTKSDGSYALRIDPAIDLDTFTSVNGSIDISLMANSAYGVSTYEGQLLTADLSGGSRSAKTGSLPSLQDITLVESATSDSSAEGAPSEVPDSGVSTTAQYTYLGKPNVRIGYTAPAGSTGINFKFRSGSMSQLGVGVKFGAGGFEASGTVSRDSASTSYWPGDGGVVFGTDAKRYFYTNYHYGKYYTPGNSDPCSYWPSTTRIKATSHAGGFKIVYTDALTGANHCNVHSGNTGHTQDHGRAYNWGFGADLSAWIGIDLSARTGHNVGTTHGFQFKERRYLCGSDGSPMTGDYVGNLRVRASLP